MIINTAPQKVLFLLGGVAILLAIISIIVNVLNIHGYCDSEIGVMLLKNFSVDKERNVPTYFSSSNLLIASILMGICHVLNLKHKGQYGWIILSVVLLYISFDEITEVHEYFASVMRRLGVGNNETFFYIVWTIPYIAFGGFVLLVLLKFLFSLPKYLRVGYLLSGAVFVVGAIGFEVISHLNSDIKLFYILVSTLEELFEMLGVILFIYYTLTYFNREFQSITFEFEKRKEQVYS